MYKTSCIQLKHAASRSGPFSVCLHFSTFWKVKIHNDKYALEEMYTDTKP